MTSIEPLFPKRDMTHTDEMSLAARRCRNAAIQEIKLLRSRKALGQFDRFPEMLSNIKHYRTSHGFYTKTARLMTGR